MKPNKPIEQIQQDYHLFLDIQMGKYLKSVNRSEFNSEDEAKNVLGKIIDAYNTLIAPKHDRLDNSTTETKTDWFNSVEINFQTTTANQTKNNETNGREALKEMENYYEDLFPFLPEGAVFYLILAGPALEAYGYSIERFNEVIQGKTPTPIEEDLFLWAYNLTAEIMQAYLKKKSAREKYIKSAIYIAETNLNEKTAIETVAKIFVNIEELFSKLNENKKNK